MSHETHRSNLLIKILFPRYLESITQNNEKDTNHSKYSDRKVNATKFWNFPTNSTWSFTLCAHIRTTWNRILKPITDYNYPNNDIYLAIDASYRTKFLFWLINDLQFLIQMKSKMFCYVFQLWTRSSSTIFISSVITYIVYVDMNVSTWLCVVR